MFSDIGFLFRIDKNKNSKMTLKENNLHWLEYPVLLLLLGLAAYLRLTHLENNPAWFADEGVHLDIARHLSDGKIQFMAVTGSHLLFARLPLFELLLSTCVSIFNYDLLTLRSLTASLGVLTVVILWWVTRNLSQDRILALLAAGVLAIYPQAILYSRFGFSYNLIAPFVLLMLWGLSNYWDEPTLKWGVVAGVAVGIGTISDIVMFVFLLPLLGMIGYRCWRHLPGIVFLTFMPFAAYSIFMLATAPDYFVFDAQYTFNRVSLPLAQQMTNFSYNYTLLLTQEAWFFAALVGLFLIPSLRVSLFLFLWMVLAVGRVAALYGLNFYYLIPLMPLIALGVASLIRVGGAYILTQFRNGIGLLLVILLIIAPIWMILDQNFQNMRGRWSTQIDDFLIDGKSARAVAVFIHQCTEKEDRVIVSPAIGWLIERNITDFPMGAATLEGNEISVWGEITLPKARFHHDPRYTQAKYVVVDNLWLHWGVQNVEGVAAMLKEVETWPMVFQSGEIRVYENPAIPQLRSDC